METAGVFVKCAAAQIGSVVPEVLVADNRPPGERSVAHTQFTTTWSIARVCNIIL
jgi:hypothetical protein